jgi:hypothetical protein
MNEEILQQIFAELFSSLEPLETQIVALQQFLKSKGTVTDEGLASFLEQAGKTSNIRWRAARVRTAALISSALKPGEEHGQAPLAQPNRSTAKPASQTDSESAMNTASESNEKRREQKAQGDDVSKPEVKKLAIKKPAEDKENKESREVAVPKKTEKSAPKASDADEDLRNSKLSNPPPVKASNAKAKDKNKDKEVKSAKANSSEQSPEAESKRKAA